MEIELYRSKDEQEKRLSLAKEKLTKIRESRDKLIEQAHKNRYPFTILITGSSSYGFNNVNQGRLDDVDCIGIIPDTVNTNDLFSRVELDNKDEPNRDEIRSFLNETAQNTHSPNIIRVSGNLEGVKTSIYFTKQSTLISNVNNYDYPLKLLAPKGHSRLLEINRRFEMLGTGNKIEIDPNIEEYEQNPNKILVPECIIKRVNIEGSDVYVKGALADKLLISKVGYSVDSAYMYKTMSNLWKNFIGLSLTQKQYAKSSDIISTIIKSPFFSSDYRKNMEMVADLFISKKLYE